MKKISLLSVLILAFVSSYPVFAAVDLPWSTTYDCADWLSYSATLSCDGLSKGGNWTCSGGEYEQIISDANMAAGEGGKGQRHWEGDGNNNNSGGTYLVFNSAQSEIWIRWYMRYQSGFAWSSLVYDKLLYLHTANSYHIPEWVGLDGFSLGSQAKSSGGTTHYCTCSNCGWTTIMGGATSDGLWHCYEIHLKMDTDGTDGVGEMWIDENLIISKTDVDFGTSAGWINFLIGSNQLDPNNGGCEYVDFDDMAVSATGYIGPLSESAKEITVTNQFDGDISIDFGSVDINTTSDCVVTVKNDGGEDLTIGELSGLAAPFTLQTNNCDSAVLGAGASCTCTVRYSPTSVGSSTQDTLVIPSDDADENPVNVTCDGSGKEPVSGVSLGATVGVSGGGVEWH